MNIWTVSHGQDGYAVHLSEVPAWAYLAETAFNVFEQKVLRCCLGNPPGWMFDVPMFSRQREEGLFADLYVNSLASRMIDAHNYLTSLTWYHKRGREHRIEIDEKLGVELWGDASRYWEDGDDDA